MSFQGHSKWLAAATFAFGLALAVAAAQWQSRENDREATHRFDELSRRASDQVVARMRYYEDGLRATRGAYVAAGNAGITRRHFREFIDTLNIDREYPGARGFGVIKRVPVADAAAFVAEARNDDWPPT